MGAKSWMLAYSKGEPREVLRQGPLLDREATIAFATQLFDSEKLDALEDGDLSFTCPPDNEIVVGCYPDLIVLAAKEFRIDRPSRLPSRFIEPFSDGVLYLYAMHSTVDWLAFAKWNKGKLQRSLSLSPDSGILEDIGDKFPFEAAYWAGSRPAVDPSEDDAEYPLAFHPLDLGEDALREFFGYQLEGLADPAQLAPERIPIMRFKRKRAWWRFG